jgi:hypothetical protein
LTGRVFGRFDVRFTPWSKIRYSLPGEHAAYATVRRYLAARADLIGAIRLPNTAFKANAGTEVTTDILFLQKRAPGTQSGAETWQDLAEIQTPERPAAINEYFARHPETMLGEMRLQGSLYLGREPTLAGEMSAARLEEIVGSLPPGIYGQLENPPEESIVEGGDVHH